MPRYPEPVDPWGDPSEDASARRCARCGGALVTETIGNASPLRAVSWRPSVPERVVVEPLEVDLCPERACNTVYPRAA